MNPTIYVVANLAFNHSPDGDSKFRQRPLHPTFLNQKNPYVFYLVDEKIPPSMAHEKVILEKDLDPVLHEAGKHHLAEWSFLLAERQHRFCQYPFFVISSRFYEKNRWLYNNLNEEWTTLFQYLMKYGWGFLPSYDRLQRWVSLDWKRNNRKQKHRYRFEPFKGPAVEVPEEIWNLKLGKDYTHAPDLPCHYIGFASYEHLKEYVDFYLPLIHYFLDENYQLKKNLSEYFRYGGFPREKPITFLIEGLSHLFFHQKNKHFFCLHYLGYFEIDMKKRKMTSLKRFPIAWTRKLILIRKSLKRKIKFETYTGHLFRVIFPRWFQKFHKMIRKPSSTFAK